VIKSLLEYNDMKLLKIIKKGISSPIDSSGNLTYHDFENEEHKALYQLNAKDKHTILYALRED